jgi:flagellar hook-basal body complex protein FliE
MNVNSLSQLTPLTASIADRSPVGQAGGEFANLLETMLNKVNTMQQNGEEAITRLHGGDAGHLHEVMIAVEQADISLRMLVQMRNKALTAYEEIMRMQI